MKHVLSAFALLISACLLSQETIQPTFKKIQLGVTISPDYCYRTLLNNDGQETTNWAIAGRADETAKLGYTIGLSGCFNLSSRFGIETGIHYSNKGYSRYMDDLVYSDLIDPRKGFISETSEVPVALKFTYNHYYIDLPVNMVVTLGRERMRFVGGLGVTTNVGLNETTRIQYTYEDGRKENKTSGQSGDFRSFNISPSISAGIDYRISNHLNLRIQPTLRYGVMKVMTDTPVSMRLWNAGLSITCYYGR